MKLCAYLLVAGMSSMCLAQPSVCARVTIKIDQTAVITRNAFRATLALGNESSDPADTLSQIFAEVDIQSADGKSANGVFGIPDPDLTNLSDVHGGGSIGPNTTGTASWLLIPTDDAAPTAANVDYYVGGSFSYILHGQLTVVPLYPVKITVLPNPKLFVKYYLQKYVYSDNPFTPDVIEPAEPFSLGLMVSNAGDGVANQFTITSGQPRIVENDKGLLITFQLIGSQIGVQNVAPSLTVNLGDIGPGNTAVARWLMTSSLQGEFTSYDATFTHTDGLNNSRLSLIDGVSIFELNHVARLDVPSDDNAPDFLVNNPPTSLDQDMPTELHTSDGQVLPVALVANPMISGVPTDQNLSVSLTAMRPAGEQNSWTYIRALDPSAGADQLIRIVRSDGKVIAIGDVANAWVTHRFITTTQSLEHAIHILDYLPAGSTTTYTLTYSQTFKPGGLSVAGGVTQRSNVSSLAVPFSTATNLGTRIADGTIAQAVTLWKRGINGAPATQVSIDVNRYAWSSQANTLTLDLTQGRTGGRGPTMLSDGNYELRLACSMITNAIGAPLPDTDGVPDGVFTFGAAKADNLFNLAGDATADRTVNFADSQLIRNAWNTHVGNPGFNANADLNGDGVVDDADLQIIQNNWLHTLGF